MFVLHARGRFENFLDWAGIGRETTLCLLFWSTIGTGLEEFSSSQSWVARIAKLLIQGIWWLLIVACVLLTLFATGYMAWEGRLWEVGLFWASLIVMGVVLIIGLGILIGLVYLAAHYACPIKIKRDKETSET